MNQKKTEVFENEDEDDDGNPILKEIPVYLSQSLAENLVLYQYPLEHNGLNTENSNVIQCCIKENLNEIMLELERNTNNPNFCVSKGEQIAINVDGKDISDKNPEEVTFPRGLMDKQMLVSMAINNQNYAVGVLHENEIHITPLKAVALLRPSFKYIDKADRRLKGETKDNLEGDVSNEEEEPKQIIVKFARQETEKTKAAREKSFAYFNKKHSKGIWYKSNFYNKGSDKSEMEFYKLYCDKPSDKAKELKMEASEILQTVCNTDDNKLSSHGDSLSLLQKLTLGEKVKKLLFQVKLIHFSQLIKYLGKTSEVQDYLKVIQQVAVMVQGCWVVQSDIVYFKEVVPGGISGNMMRTARDYILYLFTKSRVVSRQKILDIVKLPSSIIEEILQDLAYLLPLTREWEFMLQTDHDFVKMYPEVAQRQYIKWEMKHEQLMENLKNFESNAGSSPAKHRRKSHRDSSISSDNESGVENKRNTYLISGHKIRRTRKNSASITEVNSKAENT